MDEIWKDIKNYEGMYQISNTGKVKSFRNNEPRIMKTSLLQGYPVVQLSNHNDRHTFELHRLVAEAFIPNPNNYPFINHKNEIRNDNRINNLEWCSQKMNVNHSKRKMFHKVSEEDHLGNKFIYTKRCSTIHKGKKYTYDFYRVSIPRIKVDKIFSKYDDAFEYRNKCLPILEKYYKEKQIEFKIN